MTYVQSQCEAYQCHNTMYKWNIQTLAIIIQGQSPTCYEVMFYAICLIPSYSS